MTYNEKKEVKIAERVKDEAISKFHGRHGHKKVFIV